MLFIIHCSALFFCRKWRLLFFHLIQKRNLYENRKNKQLKTFKLEGFSYIFQRGNITRVGVLPVSSFHRLSQFIKIGKRVAEKLLKEYEGIGSWICLYSVNLSTIIRHVHIRCARKKVLNLKKQFSVYISEHHDKVRKDDIVFTQKKFGKGKNVHADQNYFFFQKLFSMNHCAIVLLMQDPITSVAYNWQLQLQVIIQYI